jgi:hypothetical protein
MTSIPSKLNSTGVFVFRFMVLELLITIFKHHVR